MDNKDRVLLEQAVSRVLKEGENDVDWFEPHASDGELHQGISNSEYFKIKQKILRQATYDASRFIQGSDLELKNMVLDHAKRYKTIIPEGEYEDFVGDVERWVLSVVGHMLTKYTLKSVISDNDESDD